MAGIKGMVEQTEAYATLAVLAGAVLSLVGVANPLGSLVTGAIGSVLVVDAFAGALYRTNVLK